MAKNKYGIVRLDRVSNATADGRLKAEVALENGMFVVQDEVTGELKLPTAITEKTVLVASIANQYESMNEGDFVNEAGSYARTYDLASSNVVTLTCFALEGLDARATFASITKGDVGTVAAVTGKLMFTPVDKIPATASAKYEVIGKTKLNGDDAVQVKRIA